jgi:hypothetical protein
MKLWAEVSNLAHTRQGRLMKVAVSFTPRTYLRLSPHREQLENGATP